jgi:flagellar FliL protein
MKKIIIIAGVAVVLVATAAGLYFTGIIHPGASKSSATAEAKVKELPPVYLLLDPPFVVNFTHRGTLRYLQVSLELMYHDPALLAKVTERMPVIRNDLILLFSNQDYEKLSSSEGKEMLRHEIFRAINHVIGFDPLPPPAEPLGLEPAAPSAPPAEQAAPPAAVAANPADKAEKAPIDPDTLGEVYITNFVMQ